MSRIPEQAADRPDISRRLFLGAAAGSAALALLRVPHADAKQVNRSALLRDYSGRLCYNENPLGPSPGAITAITDAATMGHRYPDWYSSGLRNDLASIHGVPDGQIVAGCGATEILRLCALAFADPDGNVVCPYPSYGQFPGDCQFLGASVRYADLDPSHRIDLTAMSALVDGQTTAVCLTNANNPTATVLPAADIAAFVDALPSHVAVIIDEAYHEYIHDPGYESAMELVRQGKKVVVVRTFSKVFGLAGVRAGYAVGEYGLISQMFAWHIYATVSRLSQDAARAALIDAQHIADTVTLNDDAKQYCFSNFDLMGLTYIPSETNFFMVDVGVPASTVSSELLARGIQVRTGWGMPNHLRVSTGTMQEMEDFITALQEILGSLGAPDSRTSATTELYGNFPNPMRLSTEIKFSLASAGEARIEIYNIRGQLVRTLVSGHTHRGHHSVEWDATDARGAPVAPGAYFFRLETGATIRTRRLIVAH